MKTIQPSTTATRRSKTARVLAGSIAALFAVQGAHAANGTWNGSTNDLWSDSTNWSPNTVPGTTNTATFNAPSINTTLDLDTGVTIGSILFDTGSAPYIIGNFGPNGQTLVLDPSGAVTVNAGVTASQLFNATLVLDTAFTVTNNSTASLTFGGDITEGSNGVNTVIFTGAGTANVTNVTGVISDGAGMVALSKTGAGRLTISSPDPNSPIPNTYTGGTTVSAGTLILGKKKGFGTGPVTLAGGVNFRTVNFEGNQVGTPGDVFGALPNDFILSGGKVNVDVSFGNKDIWLNTAVSGPGGFVLTGSGRAQGLTLSGAKTFEGGVTLGTVGSGDTTNVSIDHVASLGIGILRSELQSTNTTDGGLRLNADLSAGVTNNIVIASGARIIVNHVTSQPATLSGIISDEGTGGGLIKQGGSTLTLSGANTFKGSTQVFSGILALGHTSALGGSTLNYNNQGGTLSYGTLTAAMLGGLTGAQDLALSNDSPLAVALSVGNNNANTTYAGTFTDGAAVGGSLTKVGNGTLTLSSAAALSQNGATNVNAGTLLLTDAAASVPASAVSVNSGGTLGVNTNVLNLNNTLTLNNPLTFNGTSAFQVQTGDIATGSAVVTGDLAVNGTPTLRLASNGTTPTAGTKTFLTYTGTLTNNAAWTVDASQLNASGSQVSNWTDGNSTWDTAANWSQQGWGGTVIYDNPNKQVKLTGFAVGNVAPFATTLATIAPGNAAAVTGPAAAATVASLAVGNGGANAHSLTLQAGGPLTVSGALTVNGNGTVNASAAALSSGTLNMSGGSVTLGAGASAGVVNLTSGTLAATAGNELAVSSKLVKGTTTITAGTSAFKVGGSNLVSSIDKVMLQGGTTKVVNATYGTITVTDTGTVWSTNNGTAISNPFTVSPSANVLVVNVNWRASNINASTLPPVLTYNGVALTQAANAYDTGGGNWANAAVYYIYNPTTGANPLALSFPQGGIIDYAVDAFTLGGADTAYHPETSGGTAGILPLTSQPTTSLTLNNIPVHGVASSSVVYRTTNGLPTSLVGTVSSGSFGALVTSGPGGGTGLQWKANAPAGFTIVGAGVLVTDITSSSLTTTVTADRNSARFGLASVAFAPTSTLLAINQPTTAVNVTAASTLDLGAAPSVTLGALTMESGSSLTLTNAPSVTFNNIVANGTSQITAGVPITLSGGSVNVATGATLTVGNALTAGTLTKQGDGTLNFGVAAPLAGVGNLASTAGTTNVNTALGSGSAAVTLTGASTVKFGSVSQTLGSLTIGAGSTVILTSGIASFSGEAPSFGDSFGGEAGGEVPSFGDFAPSFDGTAAVPEPGAIGLLLAGALGILNRRRKA